MTKFYLETCRKQLDEVKDWLVEERSLSKRGFHNNIDNIENSSNLNMMSCITFKSKTIGFTTWRLQDKIAYIDIFEIHPAFHKRGFGKQLLESLTSFFISKGGYVIELRFVSEESLAFWTKMGFQRFQGEDFPSVTDKHLYKVIVQSQPRATKRPGIFYIEIWDNTYMASNKPSLIAYDLVFKNGSAGKKLALPIVTPCNHDWAMKLNLGNTFEVLKVKYFDFVDYHPNFLIIESL